MQFSQLDFEMNDTCDGINFLHLHSVREGRLGCDESSSAMASLPSRYKTANYL